MTDLSILLKLTSLRRRHAEQQAEAYSIKMRALEKDIAELRQALLDMEAPGSLTANCLQAHQMGYPAALRVKISMAEAELQRCQSQLDAARDALRKSIYSEQRLAETGAR